VEEAERDRGDTNSDDVTPPGGQRVEENTAEQDLLGHRDRGDHHRPRRQHADRGRAERHPSTDVEHQRTRTEDGACGKAEADGAE
jgi:hypothetical protein